jgi:hypothetical protein
MNRTHKGGKLLLMENEPKYPAQEPGGIVDALFPGFLPAHELEERADRYGDVALGVESAWPTGMVAR